MPSLESPWIPTCPLPCSLSKKVHSSKPVAVGVVSIKHLESVHDQIVLILTGGLGQEPIVLDEHDLIMNRSCSDRAHPDWRAGPGTHSSGHST